MLSKKSAHFHIRDVAEAMFFVLPNYVKYLFEEKQ